MEELIKSKLEEMCEEIIIRPELVENPYFISLYRHRLKAILIVGDAEDYKRYKEFFKKSARDYHALNKEKKDGRSR